MQLALEALEDANDVARMEFSDEDYYSEAINALRQALETKREWVGLTDDEMEALFLNEDGVRFARYIESRLKDKNA